MTTLQRLQAYRDNPNISQSELKAILSGKQLNKKPSLTMLLGSYLDACLLTPEIKNELYIVSDIERPTQTIVDLCESLYDWIVNGGEQLSDNLEDHLSTIEQWIDIQDYYKNRPKTRVEKFIKEGQDWWTVLVNKGEKEIITSLEELNTELTCLTLQSDSDLDWLWKGQFQKDFYWEEDGIGCKGLGDICIENCYVDLKYTTCNTIEDWIKVCANLNYPFQMAFYKSGLNVEQCKWLVVSKDWHQLVDVNEFMLQIGKWGYSKYENIRIGKVTHEIEKRYYGYKDGLEMIKGVNKSINQIYSECIIGQ